ncbi:MAG: methylated-DNA--[protein]-cysteine S-methyltransferase [Vicinamibacterales bacterium]
MAVDKNSPGAFRDRVLSVVRRVPSGRVTGYGTVAALSGNPRAARAVGVIMRTSKASGVPYHRVISSDGRLGGYGGNVVLKGQLLAAEGLVVRGGRVRGLDAVWWPSRDGASRPTRERTPQDSARTCLDRRLMPVGPRHPAPCRRSK